MYAYHDPNRDSYLNIKEAAQEAWRGLTAFVQGVPYLVIDKEGSVYTLEGEDGTILKLEHFEWQPGDEYNKLIAASRLPESPLAEGQSFDGIFMGKLAYEDGRWEVLTDDGSAVVPIDEFVDHIASNNWFKFADETQLWVLTANGQVIHAPVDQVHSHPQMIYATFGSDPEMSDLYGGAYQAMGEIRNGQVHLSALLPPDYSGEGPARWEAIKVGRQVRRALKSEGINTSMTMTASSPQGDVEFPLYSSEAIRQVNDPEQVRQAAEGNHVFMPPAGLGGHTNMYFHQNGMNAKLRFPPTSNLPDGAEVELPGNIRPYTQWQFSHWDDNGGIVPMNEVPVELVESSHSPEEVEQAFRDAERMMGRRGHVEEEYRVAQAAIESAHEDGLRCPECGSHSMRALHVENDTASMKCLTCGNEFAHEVTKNFTDHKSSLIMESEYHYIRKEGDEYCIWQKGTGKTLSCHATKEKAEEAFRAMMSDKHGADIPLRPDQVEHPGDLRTLTFNLQGEPQTVQVHAENLALAIKELVDRGATDVQIGYSDSTPGDLTLPENWASMQKGSPYPSDSYKNAPDHTPKGQKKWPEEVNAIYNACMREGNGRGDTKEEKESSCAAIAWAQYKKNDGHPKDSDKRSSAAHTPGTRVEVTHPSAKGQRGSILKNKGTDKATGEDTYDVLYDNGEKAEGLRHSDLKRIKSAKFNSDEHFLETVPILPKEAAPYPGLAPVQQTPYPQNPAGGQSYPGFNTDSTSEECPNCHSHNTMVANMVNGAPFFRCLDCGTSFQGHTASVKTAWNDVNGNPITPGGWYVMHSPKYKVPDVVQVLNLEDTRIEAAIEGDENYHFPLHISSDDVEANGYSFEPYTHEEYERREHTADTSPDPNQRQAETMQRIQELLASGASQDEVKAVLDQYYAIQDQQQEQAQQVQTQQPAPNQVPGQMLTHNKEARKSFTPAQQRELINENMSGRARNFDKLNLEGTHYESQVKEEDDPFFLWL